jgi:hypothetical protein
VIDEITIQRYVEGFFGISISTLHFILPIFLLSYGNATWSSFQKKLNFHFKQRSPVDLFFGLFRRNASVDIVLIICALFIFVRTGLKHRLTT